MQPTCIMMQRAHKAKQTIAEKGNGSRRQEVKDRGGGEDEEEATRSGGAERMDVWGGIGGGREFENGLRDGDRDAVRTTAATKSREGG